jgi:hypothetical protein
MTVPAPAPAPAAPTNPAIEAAANVQAPPVSAPKPSAEKRVRVRGYERAVQVKAKLDAEDDAGETAPEPAAEPTRAEPSPSRPKAAPSAADSGDEARAAPSDEVAAREKRAAERIERIRAAQAREQAEKAKRTTSQQARARDGEVEQLRKRIAELEPHAEVFKDEETLLAAAEARGMSAQKLVEWMRARLNDPSVVAQRHAKTEADALRAELRKLQDRLDQEAEERRIAAEQAREQHEGQQKAYQFVGKVKASEESHPLTAALMKKYDENTVLAFANRFVAPMLPPDYALQELHDHVEQLLEEVQMYGPAALSGTQDGKSPSPKNAAGQAPNTLSNRTAQERVSVTQERPAHLMPRSERVARLKRKLDGEDE